MGVILTLAVGLLFGIFWLIVFACVLSCICVGCCCGNLLYFLFGDRDGEQSLLIEHSKDVTVEMGAVSVDVVPVEEATTDV